MLFVCDETLIGKLQIVMNSAVISYEVLNASCPEYIKELMEMFGRTERVSNPNEMRCLSFSVRQPVYRVADTRL